jgi:hypothetical protein
MYGVLASADEMVSDFGAPRGNLALGVIVIAEKGIQSTADVLPIQDQYRGEADWGRYRASVDAMSSNEQLPMFEAPTALEMVKLDVRQSKSFRYLGVLRPNETHSSDVKSFEGDLPDQIGVGGLRVIAATYGGCGLGAVPTVAGVCAAYRGNVTDILASLANGHEEWHWTIDVQILGDPLRTVGKDLEVLYYYADEIGPKVRRAYIQPEAAGKALVLSRAMQSSG